MRDTIDGSPHVVSLVRSYVDDSAGVGAILFDRVGFPLKSRKKDVFGSLESLRALHIALGVSHGDARKENTIWANHEEKKVVWVDLRTAQIVLTFSVEQRKELFLQDIETLLASFGTQVDRSALESVAFDYLEYGKKLALFSILEVVKSIWSSRTPRTS